MFFTFKYNNTQYVCVVHCVAQDSACTALYLQSAAFYAKINMQQITHEGLCEDLYVHVNNNVLNSKKQQKKLQMYVALNAINAL